MHSYSLNTVEEVLEEFHTSVNGLKEADVLRLRQQYGSNELPKKKRSLIILFLRQFQSVLVYILFGALALSLVMPFLEGGEVHIRSFLDAFVILAILLLNAVLGFVQEFKAESAIEMLEKLTAPTVRVRRNGAEQILPSKELVPGDIVILEAGDRISADGRLLEISHFRTNESSLTGESSLENKDVKVLKTKRPVADQHNMVFAGTLVGSGSAEYIVTATGIHTEIGKIAQLVSETEIPETPLQGRMKQLGEVIGIVVLVMCGFVMILGWLHGRTFFEILLTAVSLAVSAVPEGLPAVVTVCFAIGVKRMVKKNALVRKLDSLETLGSVTVICSDKTGTITENRMKVIKTWLSEKAKKGDEKLLLQIAASCNRAKLPNLGDPTELGLLEYAEEKKIKQIKFDEEEVPFSSEEKYMQTRHGKVSYLKGAPEKILELCDYAPSDVADMDTKMAKQGLRVLGFAIKESGKVRFVGLIGMEDPPRASVRAAIKEAKQAGIRSIMITGDNIETARAIAKKIGIVGDAVRGGDLDKMTHKQLRERVGEIAVYARVSPIHKLQILRALQDNGEIVAMSGDGVNDAPALKGAHVGISMGKVGTQVAREASSVVLADDHFSTMVTAVREGRRIYDNIRKFVLFLLRANFDEILLIMTTLMLDLPLPYLPIHILWINLMTDSFPALALGLEKAEPDIMKKPPRPSGESILSGEWGSLIFASVLAYAFAFGLFVFLLYIGEPLAEARSVTLMMAITFELLLAHTVRSKKPLYKIGFFGNRWLLWATALPFLFQFVIVYTPLNILFHLVPLSFTDWVLAIGLAVTGFIVFETIKLIPRKKKWL